MNSIFLIKEINESVRSREIKKYLREGKCGEGRCGGHRENEESQYSSISKNEIEQIAKMVRGQLNGAAAVDVDEVSELVSQYLEDVPGLEDPDAFTRALHSIVSFYFN